MRWVCVYCSKSVKLDDVVIDNDQRYWHRWCVQEVLTVWKPTMLDTEARGEDTASGAPGGGREWCPGMDRERD